VTTKPSPLAFLVFLVAGWISRKQLIVVEYLMAENRLLCERFSGRSLSCSDAEFALLARKAFRIPCKVLLALGTVVAPDTLLRWHGCSWAAMPHRRPSHSCCTPINRSRSDFPASPCHR
jgi:putative transposase